MSDPEEFPSISGKASAEITEILPYLFTSRDDPKFLIAS
jgi:hypothetical protein